MSYSSYLAKQEAKGDWKPGDRVRVKSEYQGKTYAARVKRQGDWVVDHFLNANWELKRPDDWTGPSHYPKRLRAKSYQIVMAPPKAKPAEPKVEDKLSKKIEELSKPQVDVQVYRPGMVVLIKHPEGKYKGLYVTTEHGTSQLNWIAVAPLFGGIPTTAKTEYIMVIPEKDLTITYLPQ